MISAELLSEVCDGCEVSLKKSVEGRAVLELYGHDVLTVAGGSPSLIDRMNFLGSNLVTFITGAPMPASNRRPNFEGALAKDAEGAKILAAVDNDLMGMERDLAIIEKMAAHVVVHGRRIVASAALPPAAPTSYAEYRPPKPAPAPVNAGDELVFPEAAAALASGRMVGPTTKDRAALKVKDLDTPPDGSPAAAYLKVYENLLLAGNSMKSGAFYQRHRKMIKQALEDRRYERL